MYVLEYNTLMPKNIWGVGAITCKQNVKSPPLNSLPRSSYYLQVRKEDFRK